MPAYLKPEGLEWYVFAAMFYSMMYDLGDVLSFLFDAASNHVDVGDAVRGSAGRDIIIIGIEGQ